MPLGVYVLRAKNEYCGG